MAKQYVTIDRWNGGLSDGDILGSEGSFRFGQGLDYKSNPNAITADLIMEKKSASIVVTLPKWFTYDTPRDDTYAYDSGGNIYQSTSTGSSWTLLRAVASSAGQGLEIYDDYLFYTQASQIGRYGVLSGTPSFTDNWQTGLNGSTNWRPIKVFQNLLCVGNGRYLAIWDGSAWTATKLTFPNGWYVRDLQVRGDYLAIAVNDSSTIQTAVRGIVFYWDGSSSTYNFFNEVPENGGISSIQASQDKLYIFAGGAGNIFLDNGTITKIKRIPFMGRGKLLYVNPGATTNFRGNLLFGFGSGGASRNSSTVYRGIYELDSVTNALNFAYPTSTGTVQTSSILVGNLFAAGSNLYTGWQNQTPTYGIDLLSTSNQQTSVTYESRIVSVPREASFDRIKVLFDTLASGQSITVKYKADRNASWTTYGDAAISFTADGAVTYKVLNEEIRATDFQIQLTLAGGATSMPTVFKVIIEYEEESRL